MAIGILMPADIGEEDAARVLAFINAAPHEQALANAVGFGEGPAIGLQVAASILAARDAAGGFRGLDQVLGATSVNAARFTEIVVALSSAQPPRDDGGRRVLLRPTLARSWLGQHARIAVQVTDRQGRGLPNAPITCVTTWGILAGLDGTEVQRGASIALRTGPGGLLTISLEPPLSPPLPEDEWASLTLALDSLGTPATSAIQIGPVLATLAERYRLEASEALRNAVDRLHEAFGASPMGTAAAFPIIPVTLIALAGEEDGPAMVTVTTLRVLNWLGPFLAVLSDAVAQDDRLAVLLKPLQTAGATGENLARGLIGATRAIAGMERGRLGQAARDQALGGVVNQFVAENITRFDKNVFTDVVRAAATSGSAIANGGFAVFNAIETTKEVRDVTGIRGADTAQLNQQLAALDSRMDKAESEMVTNQSLEALRQDTQAMVAQSRSELTTRYDGRLSALESDRVSKADLAALDTRLSQRTLADQDQLRREFNTTLDTRLSGVVLKADLGPMQTRLATLESSAIQRSELPALQASIGAAAMAPVSAQLQAVTTRLDGLERDSVTQARLDAFGKDILAGANANATRLSESTRADLRTEIATKADATTVRSIDTRVSTRLDGLDQRVGTIRRTPG